MTDAERLATGMRRVRLLLWQLFNRTPLEIEIEEWVERAAARHCRLTWEQYLAYKAKYPELWQQAEARRLIAKARGRFAAQPPQLRRYRKQLAKQKRVFRKARPRFNEWASKKLVRARQYKRTWLRQRVTDRLYTRLLGR